MNGIPVAATPGARSPGGTRASGELAKDPRAKNKSAWMRGVLGRRHQHVFTMFDAF